MYHSPMAELFDHMCDSITTVLYGLTVPSALSLGASNLTVILLISSFVGFFAPTWEHLHVRNTIQQTLYIFVTILLSIIITILH